MIDACEKIDNEPNSVRSLFISDIHLGTRDCQAQRLLHLLQRTRFEYLYLVGDIVDGWRLKARWYWPPSHDAVVRCLLQRQQEGARILYIPGNHDEFLRSALGLRIGGIELVGQAIHRGADGRRHLVVHGDGFDRLVGHMRRLSALGIWVYAAAVLASDAAIRCRRRWRKSTDIVPRDIRAFEQRAAEEARRQRLDGVICGHVHYPAMHERFGVQYVNTGDWVHSCTAGVEHFDGTFALLHAPVGAMREAAPRAAAAVPAWTPMRQS